MKQAIEVNSIGWVISRAKSANWDDDRDTYADMSQVVYDLYARESVDTTGLIADAIPVATVTNAEFEALGLHVNWSDMDEEGGEIGQGGEVRE